MGQRRGAVQPPQLRGEERAWVDVGRAARGMLPGGGRRGRPQTPAPRGTPGPPEQARGAGLHRRAPGATRVPPAPLLDKCLYGCPGAPGGARACRRLVHRNQAGGGGRGRRAGREVREADRRVRRATAGALARANSDSLRASRAPCSRILHASHPRSAAEPGRGLFGWTLGEPAGGMAADGPSERGAAVPARQHVAQGTPEQLSNASTVNSSTKRHRADASAEASASASARFASQCPERASASSSVHCSPRTQPSHPPWPFLDTSCLSRSYQPASLQDPLPSLSPSLATEASPAPTPPISSDFAAYFSHRRAHVQEEEKISPLTPKQGSASRFESVLESTAPPTALYILE